jgi:hypothetical protein
MSARKQQMFDDNEVIAVITHNDQNNLSKIVIERKHVW